MQLKVYVAGKVSPNSVFGTHDWRDAFCSILQKKSGFSIVNLDPTKEGEDFQIDETNSDLKFGRDAYMISISDFVIVNLTDDISVGGSQEMLIAKYFHKPLIGIAPLEGKFRKKEAIIRGKKFPNWTHPFVAPVCDTVVETIEEAAREIQLFVQHKKAAKDISLIDRLVSEYKDQYLSKDSPLHFE